MNDEVAVAAAEPTPPTPRDISDELWREYEWSVMLDGKPGRVCQRIANPVGLVVGTTTHRVLDANGVVHCVPNVGHLGCTLRWKVKEGRAPIRF